MSKSAGTSSRKVMAQRGVSKSSGTGRFHMVTCRHSHCVVTSNVVLLLSARLELGIRALHLGRTWAGNGNDGDGEGGAGARLQACMVPSDAKSCTRKRGQSQLAVRQAHRQNISQWHTWAGRRIAKKVGMPMPGCARRGKTASMAVVDII